VACGRWSARCLTITGCVGIRPLSAPYVDGVGIEDWFLTAAERGNPATRLPAWCPGNRAMPLVHGSVYFDRLVTEVEALEPGDHLFFTDWRGDPDQRMRADGPTVAELLCAAADRGVVVKGLMWRSHLDKLQYSEEENRHLGEAVARAGGEVLLDQRVRRGGSHHQKLVVLRHPGRTHLDVAFAGGIDLCHSRRDDSEHRGDPQAVPMSARYGDRPAWHDVQLELRGPVVGALDTVFRERWSDRIPPDADSPLAWLLDRLHHVDLEADPLPEALPAPPVCGSQAVQVLRTYPAMRPRYGFAPRGERSVARGYIKAVRRARRLIYLEDQYMWSAQVAHLFANALRENSGLHLVVVVPRYPDLDGRFALPPNLIGRTQAIDVCRAAGGDRVHVFDVENHAGAPVYVHAKVCVVDDVWASGGSDNFNRRSWTHDSELSCAVLDDERDERAPVDPVGDGVGARRFARDLRLTLMREHLDRPPDGSGDGDLIDPEAAVRALTETAEALETWYRDRRGPRPPGRLRRHEPEQLSPLTRAWATLPYRLVYDPDGRPWRMRRRAVW
jgi:phosphatidylserine/phosphatidylglycerophosphate/cardiolipin synthase-like enzyme